MSFYSLTFLTMHYCVYVFIPQEGDIEEFVARALWPFSDDFEVAPYKAYLDKGEIDAMAKHFDIKPGNLQWLAGKMEEWNNGPGGIDDEGLFVMKAWNPDSK